MQGWRFPVVASPSITIMENKDNANYTTDMSKDPVAHLKENPTAPVRILVSTATHLVPGDDYYARTAFIQNLITQYHFNRDFEFRRDRFESYNAHFGFDNRTCYFLMDYGQSPGGDDKAVPILWYRWTGKLLAIQEALPSQIRKKLKKVPFTPPKLPPGTRKITGIQRLKLIRQRLHSDMGLSDTNFEFLKESSEHKIWLEQNIEPRFWSKLESLEAEWEDWSRKLACGVIRRIKRVEKPVEKPVEKTSEIPGECTEMWDCECSLCSSYLS